VGDIGVLRCRLRAAEDAMSESNNPWKMIVIGCGVLAILGCCCAAVGFFACSAGLGGRPVVTTQSFFASVKAGQYDAAYALMTPAFQASHPRAGFEAEVATLPGVTTHTNVAISGMNAQNTTTTISGQLTTPNGPQGFTIDLEAPSIGAEPKIRTITVGTQTLR
jgi:hypothetical protein